VSLAGCQQILATAIKAAVEKFSFCMRRHFAFGLKLSFVLAAGMNRR
jgi:hypothetical protein